MNEKNQTEIDILSFEKEAESVLGTLQQALANVIAHVPDEITKPVDLQRSLNLDMKLCWKTFKVASATGPLAVGPHVPGTSAMKSFLKAAAKRGVPDAVIGCASDAAASFEKLVANHAGDRTTFESMASALAKSEYGEQIDLQHRRAAFRANGHIWGVQAKTRFRCDFLRTASDTTKLDLVSVEGYVQLRQLRGDAAMTLSVTHAGEGDEAPKPMPIEPLDPDGPISAGKHLIREFCSQPLPEIRTIKLGGGYVLAELVGLGVGNRAAMTCIDGWIMRGVLSRYRDDRNQVAEHGVRVHIPCEVLIIDLLVEEGAFGPIMPVTVSYGDLLNVLPPNQRPPARARLPFEIPVVYLGRGPSVLHSADVPRYAEMAKYCFNRLGWNPDKFLAYRCRVPYPVMPSTTWVRYNLPQPSSVGD